MPRKKTPVDLPEPDREAVEAAAVENAEALVLVEQVAMIATADELTFAGELLRDVTERWKALETQRKALKEPLLEAGRRLDAFFKRALDPLAAAENRLKAGILAFQAAQEQAAQAAMASTAAGRPAALPPPAQLPVGFSQRTLWNVVVVDLALVPREYLKVDETACLCAKLDRGVDEIPGIRFVERGVLTVRT